MSVSIMVVDDEPDVVDLFRWRFRRELGNGEYVTHFALSGEDALQRLRAGAELEVMLFPTDINMPGMTGIELLREVTAQWPDLPVAMITAYADDGSGREALDAGACEFLSKPIDFDALRATIDSMVIQDRSG